MFFTCYSAFRNFTEKPPNLFLWRVPDMLKSKVRGQESLLITPIAVHHVIYSLMPCFAVINPNYNSLKGNLFDWETFDLYSSLHHIALRLRPLLSHCRTNCVVTGLPIWNSSVRAKVSLRGLDTGPIVNGSIHFAWVLLIHWVLKLAGFAMHASIC